MSPTRQTGEREFIESIRRRFTGASPPAPRGIGDDAALVERAGGSLLVSTDCLIETRHFTRSEPAYLLGRKSLAVNFSDIAAMGGLPASFLLTLGIPADLPGRYLDDFLAGLRTCAREHDVNLIGGDTSSSPGPLVISITVLGRPAKGAAGRVLTRSGARPGDRIYVSGPLGGSAAGRSLLARGFRPRLDRARRRLKGAIVPSGGPRITPVRLLEALRLHLDPVPRIGLGTRLAARGIATSAMDLSDGLSLDLARLASASGVGARLLSPAIPIADCARAVAPALGLDTLRLALDGGEDYELLFTVPPAKEPLVAHLPVFCIGQVTSRRGLFLMNGAGKVTALRPGGFDHFRTASPRFVDAP